VRDQLVDLLEGAGIEQQSMRSRAVSTRFVLPARAFFTAAEFGMALEVSEDVSRSPSCLLLSRNVVRVPYRMGTPSPNP
jgi:hypothetical protein